MTIIANVRYSAAIWCAPEFIAYRGFDRIRVVAGTHPADIVNRIRRAWSSSVRSDREIA